jgi:hypothetical protein
VHILQRYQVEGKSAWDIAEELTTEFDKVCTRKNTEEERGSIKNYVEKKYNVTIG